MPNSIPVHGSCDARFTRLVGLFRESFASGTEVGAAVCFVLDGKRVVDLWGGLATRIANASGSATRSPMCTPRPRA